MSQERAWRRSSRREFLVVAGGSLLAGSLVACGDSDDDSADTSVAQPSDAPASTGAPASSTGAAEATGTTPASTATATAGAQRGGTIRVGLIGAGTKDIIDGQNALAGIGDIARLVAGWETLLIYDRAGALVPHLATEVTAEAPDDWVVKLRDGVEFHDGKTMTADDVVYSLLRATDPDAGRTGGSALSTLDRNGVTKVDDLTVRIKLSQPDSTLPTALAQYPCGIVPVDYDSREGKATSVAERQVGTNAYMLDSFTPGRESVHKRFANYWNADVGFVDEVVIVDIDDAAARVNALLAGQVDAIADVPLAQVQTVESSGMKVLNNKGGAWSTITMRIDTAPFDDVRVRQAMRLLVDREEMLARAISGYGYVGNDMYAPLDACYPSDVPQRAQDVDQARALLAEAGQENLTVDLVTTEGPGTIEMAKVFAEQAKDGGITVNVKILDSSTFFGDQYTQYPFAVDYWNTREYLPQLGQGSLPDAPFNETHWPPSDSNYLELYNQALSATDEAARCEIVQQMYALEFEQGGYIIPFFRNLVDAYAPKVGGLSEAVGILNLDYFGRAFREVTVSG